MIAIASEEVMTRSTRARPARMRGAIVANDTGAASSPIGQVDSSLDLEGSIVVLLTMLSNQISASGSLTFQKRHGLSSPEWKVMAVIGAMPGSSGIDIAQILSLDKAAVSRTMQGLTRRGLIEVARSDRGNLRAAFLSDAGKMLHAAGLGTAAERERCLLVDMTPEQRTALHDLLRAMIRRMPHVFRLADEPVDVVLEMDRDVLPALTGPQSSEALRDRVDRLESLLADVMLENAALRQR
jgi:DNA-binding MarR family transcriptional regulator